MRGASTRGHLLWVLGLCLLAGLAGSLAWVQLWTPPTATVVDGQAVLTGEAARQAFSGTGWFVVVSVAVGLPVGLVVGWLARYRELVTLAALLSGGAVAAALMRRLGPALGPEDPAARAGRLEDLATLPTALTAPPWPLVAVLPAAALAGLVLALVLAPSVSSGPAVAADD